MITAIYVLLGILIGSGLFWIYWLSKSSKWVTWYAWILFVIGGASLVYAFEILFGSYIEHEIQAGWMGFGLCLITSIVAVAIGWRFGVIDRKEKEGELINENK